MLYSVTIAELRQELQPVAKLLHSLLTEKLLLDFHMLAFSETSTVLY